jgi:hypothetical protein
MVSCLDLSVGKRGHLLPERIEDGERDMRAMWQRIADRGSRIEWVGIVLRKFEGTRKLCSILYSI